jgi:hypothetical protein
MPTNDRTAPLAYRKAHRVERLKGLEAASHVPFRAAALAVWELRKGLSVIEAEAFVQEALAWGG